MFAVEPVACTRVHMWRGFPTATERIDFVEDLAQTRQAERLWLQLLSIAALLARPDGWCTFMEMLHNVRRAFMWVVLMCGVQLLEYQWELARLRQAGIDRTPCFRYRYLKNQGKMYPVRDEPDWIAGYALRFVVSDRVSEHGIP